MDEYTYPAPTIDAPNRIRRTARIKAALRTTRLSLWKVEMNDDTLIVLIAHDAREARQKANESGRRPNPATHAITVTLKP